MNDHLISLYIDDELDLDEKIVFVETVHHDHRFTDEALGRFLDGTYAGDYQRQLVEEFESHLPDEVPWETISGNRKVAMPRVKS